MRKETMYSRIDFDFFYLEEGQKIMIKDIFRDILRRYPDVRKKAKEAQKNKLN